MWRLTMNANGPISNVSQLNVTFDFNPNALNEITFGSYLLTLPGYHLGISNTELAQLIDSEVESRVKQNFTVNPSGDAVLPDMQLFPDDTLYTAFNSSVDYSEGNAANLEETSVPEPAAVTLLALAYLLFIPRRARRT